MLVNTGYFGARVLVEDLVRRFPPRSMLLIRGATTGLIAGLAHRLAGGSRTRWSAEAVEGLPQLLGDVLRVATFDV